MNELLINALAQRVLAGQMTVEQCPIPYQEAVQGIVDKVNAAK